jgi:hypothetical protein
MKKVLVLLLSVLMVLSMAACAKKPEPLKDDTHAMWNALGQFLLADGSDNGWGDKSAEAYEKSALTAIALEDVKAISEDVYNALKDKQVKYLYTIDLLFGTNDVGWTTKCLKDGKFYEANGSYAFKIGQCSVEAEGDSKVYSVDQWISDPKTAYVEALTPATVFYPVWQEEKDMYGFSWADNPVIIGGAGLYTIIVAQYSNASSAGNPGYGVAAVLKEAKSGLEYKELDLFIPADHTFGVVGDMTGWADNADIAMEKGEGNTWSAIVDITPEQGWKVRADGTWANNWADIAGDNLTVVDNNIHVAEAGTYKVTISFDGGVKITAEKQ